MASARFIVRGKVQGVWFRASTRDEAMRLGLAGHARNLADGSVDVLAIGDAAAIDMLERWLHLGPPLARVDAVSRLVLPDDASQAGGGFETG
ncbi:acylphosphatase [Thermomonas sp.]|uniref:acylphosphatase n=1 Tax=Thermomonas sp. TaxID=1971895 RepID=UPI0035B4F747